MAFTTQNSLDLAGRLGSDPGRRDDVGLPSATGDASPPRRTRSKGSKHYYSEYGRLACLDLELPFGSPILVPMSFLLGKKQKPKQPIKKMNANKCQSQMPAVNAQSPRVSLWFCHGYAFEHVV